MFIDFLLNVFSENYDLDSVIWRNKFYNYQWLIDSIEKYKKSINAQGICKGTIVALKGDFSPNSIALFLALIEKACIIVPLTNTSNKNEKKLFNIAQVEIVYRVNEDDLISIETFSQRSDN